jgi:hypothetical protein
MDQPEKHVLLAVDEISDRNRAAPAKTAVVEAATGDIS